MGKEVKVGALGRAQRLPADTGLHATRKVSKGLCVFGGGGVAGHIFILLVLCFEYNIASFSFCVMMPIKIKIQ